jgi:hypothetical protein
VAAVGELTQAFLMVSGGARERGTTDAQTDYGRESLADSLAGASNDRELARRQIRVLREGAPFTSSLA